MPYRQRRLNLYFPNQNRAIIIRFLIRIIIRRRQKKPPITGQLFYTINSTDYPKMLKATVRPARTTETIDISLIRILRAGPEVSLNGSPTVSPTTDAL